MEERPMKCIGRIEKHTLDGYIIVDPETVVRVSDTKAHKLTDTMKYDYVPKSLWKQNGRKRG